MLVGDKEGMQDPSKIGLGELSSEIRAEIIEAAAEVSHQE